MKAVRDAGGISNLGPIPLFKVVPCLMKRVCVCASIVLGIKVTISIGSIFIICLASSTWVIGQSIHGELGPVFTDALSRSLHVK